MIACADHEYQVPLSVMESGTVAADEYRSV